MPDEPRPGFRAWASYLAYRSLGTAMQKLPEPVAAAAAAGVGLALTAGRAEARAMYARHLRRVVGPDLSDAEIRARTRRAFLSYARYWLEGARLPATPPDVVADRMLVESGYEHLVEGMAAGRGVIMALPHVGSWEWGGAWLTLQGIVESAEKLASGLRIVFPGIFAIENDGNRSIAALG